MEKNDYIWAVSYESPDDGLCNYLAFFSNEQAAQKYLESLERRSYRYAVVQTTLYYEDGRYYRIRKEEVFVDVPSREDVLAKLTLAEQRVLGLR